jgi:hypothetical protein
MNHEGLAVVLQWSNSGLTIQNWKASEKNRHDKPDITQVFSESLPRHAHVAHPRCGGDARHPTINIALSKDAGKPQLLMVYQFLF